MTPEETIRRALLILEAAQTNSQEARENEDDPLLDHAQLSVAVDMAVKILKGEAD
jgi:hypothetical protein